MDQLLKQRILSFDRAVPRYTSYPTAPHFREGFKDTYYRQWLSTVPADEPVSFYVHVPFCPRLCWFCGCHTKITQREAPVVEYADYLMREAAILADAMPHRPAIKHLHFGGGSPTILSHATFSAVLDTLRRHFTFTHDAEIAVEIDPRNFTEGLAATYAKAGVTRVSFGVQDFDEKVMEAVNRPQLFSAVYQGINMAREYGINNINIDLMYGLPHQTPESMQRLASNVISLAPDRIALFGYAHVPWIKKHMRLIQDDTLPDVSLRYDLFEITAQSLQDAGYAPIGIDHFAKPDDALAIAAASGRLRRNFQGYTADPANTLLGIGASAIGQTARGYVQNTIHIPQYRDRIDAGLLPSEKCCALSQEDKLRSRVIESLMCNACVDLRAIYKFEGRLPDYLRDSVEKLRGYEKFGLLSIEDDGARICVHHRFAVRLACAAFDTYLQPSSDATQRHVTAI